MCCILWILLCVLNSLDFFLIYSSSSVQRAEWKETCATLNDIRTASNVCLPDSKASVLLLPNVSKCVRSWREGERENCPISPFHSFFACQKNYLVGNTHSWLTVVFKFTFWFSTCYVFNILDRFCLVYSPRRFIHGSERSTTHWVNSNRRCWTWFIDSRACNFTTTPIWFIAQLTIGSNLFLIVFDDSWNM